MYYTDSSSFIGFIFKTVDYEGEADVVLEGASTQLRILTRELQRVEDTSFAQLQSHRPQRYAKEVTYLWSGIEFRRQEENAPLIMDYQQLLTLPIISCQSQIYTIEALINRIRNYRGETLALIESKVNRIKRLNELGRKQHLLRLKVSLLHKVQSQINWIQKQTEEQSPFYSDILKYLQRNPCWKAFRQHVLKKGAEALSKRINGSLVTVVEKGPWLFELLQNMKDLFTGNKLTQKCRMFVQILRYTSLTDHLCVKKEEGLGALLRPILIQSLSAQQIIEGTDVDEASSVMQFSQFTIDAWNQFLQQQLQRFYTWFYQVMAHLRQHSPPQGSLKRISSQISGTPKKREENATQLIKSNTLIKFLERFHAQFQWIATHKLPVSADLSKPRQFRKEVLRLLLQQIFKPYFDVILAAVSQKRKMKLQSPIELSVRYTILTLFKGCWGLFRLMFSSWSSMNWEKYAVAMTQHPLTEMEGWEYYQYYKQWVKELVMASHPEQGNQFIVFWLRCVSQYTVVADKHSVHRCPIQQIAVEIKDIWSRMHLEDQLERELLKPRPEDMDMVYTLATRLQFNSLRLSVVQEAFRVSENTQEFLKTQQCMLKELG